MSVEKLIESEKKRLDWLQTDEAKEIFSDEEIIAWIDEALENILKLKSNK